MDRNLYFSKEHEQVRKSIREFVKKEINPHVDEWEEQGFIPLHALFKKMGELGFLGIRYDTQYGGEGLDYWYDLVFLEEMYNIKCGGIPLAITVQTHMATPAIYEFGSEYLKETYLKPAIRGEMVSAIAVSEPDAGSDVSALNSFAKREGEQYVLYGSKTYITNGTQADFLTLLARTSHEPGYHSYSLFVVPTDLPGYSVSKKLDKLGVRSSDTAEIFFDNVRIPAQNLIGVEGEGFIQQMKQFQHERFVSMPGAYVGVRNVINDTVEYLKKRTVFGKPLIEQQALRHQFADWLAEIESLKQYAYHVVRMKMEGMDVTKEVSIGKLLAAKTLQKAVEGCIQMYGGAGFMNEMPISRAFRDSRLASVGGGANEVLREIITRMEKI